MPENMNWQLDKNKYEIITLGYNCYTRSFLARSNYIQTKEQERLSLPFDLCTSNIKGITDLLKNNFCDFFNDIIFDEELNIYRNKKYGIVFWHDNDLDSFEQFKQRYDNRIKNFRKIMSNDKIKYFIRLLGTETDSSQIIELYNCILNINPNNKLIIINYDPHKSYKLPNSNNLLYICKKYPFKNYDQIWYKDEYFLTQKHIKLMNSVIKEIDKFINIGNKHASSNIIRRFWNKISTYCTRCAKANGEN